MKHASKLRWKLDEQHGNLERIRRVSASPLFSAVCGSPSRCSFCGMEGLQAEAWIWYGFGVVEAWSELGLMAIG